MWNWLFAIRESLRLTEENLSLKDELAEVRRLLLLEIDSNRNREDALVDKIVGERTPSRQLLVPATIGEPDPTDLAAPSLTPEEERLVEKRARAYADHYERVGIPYDYDELCEAIRRNPDQHLAN